MIEWYPDTLLYYRQYESTQDASGHFVDKPGQWVELGKCRLEKETNGTSKSDNANVTAHSYIIYTPKFTSLPKLGHMIKVQRRREGKDLGELQAQVRDTEYGIYHNRIWAN